MNPTGPTPPMLGPVLSVLADRSGIIWAGSWHTGLNKYDPGSAKFDVFLNVPGDPGSLDDDSIGAIFEDSRGTLWVGTGSRSTGGTKGGLELPQSWSKIPFPTSPFPVPTDGEQVRTVHTIPGRCPGCSLARHRQGLWQLAGMTATNIYRLVPSAWPPPPGRSAMVNVMTWRSCRRPRMGGDLAWAALTDSTP